MTPDEVKVVEGVESLGAATVLVEAYGESRAVEDYAGVYLARAEEIPGVDASVGQVVVALFVADLDRHEASLLEIFPFPDRLVVRRAEVKQSDMDLLSSRIASDRAALAEIGVDIRGVGFALADAVIVVRVTGDLEEARAILIGRYGEFPLLVKEVGDEF